MPKILLYNNYGWQKNVRQGVGVVIVRRMVLAGIRLGNVKNVVWLKL